jgi:hypothetical protein
MPPYTPVTSKAQSRKLFVLEKEGKLAPGEAEGKTRAANFKSLPQHAHQHPGVKALGRVGHKRPSR